MIWPRRDFLFIFFCAVRVQLRIRIAHYALPVTAEESMASIVIQRNARGRDSHSAAQDQVEMDNRPDYLKEFPSASTILEDVKLQVLLGRFGKCYLYVQ